MKEKKTSSFETREEALFARLMQQMAEEEGRQLLRECERLNHDPAAVVPPKIDAKSLAIINNAYKGE